MTAGGSPAAATGGGGRHEQVDRFRHPALGQLAVGGALVPRRLLERGRGQPGGVVLRPGLVSSQPQFPGAKANTAERQAVRPSRLRTYPARTDAALQPLYGDPTQPPACTALQDAIIPGPTAAVRQDRDHVRRGHGPGLWCDVDYWNVGVCRAGRTATSSTCGWSTRYWKGRCPAGAGAVEYRRLGVTADGGTRPTRTPVAPPSPVQRLVGLGGAARGSGGRAVLTASGALAAANVASALTAALAEPVTSGSPGGKLISP